MYVGEIMLDFEEENPQKRLSIPRLGFVARILRLNIEDVKAWRTAKGVHVRIKLNGTMHPVTAVLIQSLMGSDYARECYNALRVYNLVAGRETSETAKQMWNVLWYRKIVDGEVVSEEKYDSELTRALMEELMP